MENTKGKGMFYGLVGVATLIVAIIGATYAYFSVTQTSDDYMYGQAATAGLNVNVYRMTGWSVSEGSGLTADTASYIMVPQLDTTLDQAIKGTDLTPNDGTDNKVPCIDAGGSLVCSIYRIVVQNTGSAAITVEGSLNFYASTKVDNKGNTNNTPDDKTGGAGAAGDNLMNHLKWARLTQPTSIVDKAYTYADVSVSSEGAEGKYHKTMPDTLLTYANGTLEGSATPGYQITPDKIVYSYQYLGSDQNPLNTHFYAINVTGDSTSTSVDGSNVTTPHIDLLNGYTVTGAHGRYTDLIDPTDDLTVTFKKETVDSKEVKTATVAANEDAENGKWYLAAKDQAGDTKVFYIVVWISENKQQQNYVDFGQFTGTVTFQSSEGSGASSTFTETAQG